MAPGGNGYQSGTINSTCIRSDSLSGYCGKQGTSMATPFVSGAIALINQYLQANGETLTPKQIESTLFQTGIRIYDSNTGLNYSRIDVYSAIRSLDIFKPNTTLVSPINGIVVSSNPINFLFNINEFILNNATLFVWNNSFNYNSTIISSNSSFSTSLILPNGNYSWNIYACDWKNNCSFSTTNATFMVNTSTSMCVSFNYSSWAQCNSSGLQSRTILSLSPNGCSGGSQDSLIQQCSPPCLESNWQAINSSCLPSNTLTRNWTKILNCNVSIVGSVNHPASEILSCVYISLPCINFTYSDWSDCGQNNISSRTVLTSSPANCQGGSPNITKSCIYVPVCAESNWNSTLSPIVCPINKQQIRSWSKMGNCTGGIIHPPEENISCIPHYTGNFSIISNNTLIVEVNYVNSSTNISANNFTVKQARFLNKSYILVSSTVSLENTTKVLYLNVSNNSKGVCFKDEEVTDIAQLQNKCTYLACPGVVGDYNCTKLGQNLIAVRGLKHSGIIESDNTCGDGICSDSESCSSCSSDCGSCPSANSGSSPGGSGGGGGSSGGSSGRSNNTGNSTNNTFISYNNSDTASNKSGSILIDNSSNNIRYPFNLFDLDFKYYIFAGLGLGIIVIILLILVILKTKRKNRNLTKDDEQFFNEKDPKVEQSSVEPSSNKDELSKDKIKELLLQGKSYMNLDMDDQARTIYEDIKNLYDRLEKKDDSIFKEIMDFYNNLKK